MGLFDFLKPKKKTEVKVSITIHEPTPADIRNQQYDAVREIKKLQEASFPSRNGLRPHEIVMLSYSSWYSVGQKDFPQFWYYKYAVDNPGNLLLSLQNRGFIRPATAKESLSNLKVAELKDILASAGIKATGKKADLVALVQGSVSEDILETKVISKKYILTELGEAELKENEYVTYLHNYKYNNISVWEINKQMQDYPSKLWRDKIWGELNRLSGEELQYTSSDNYGPYINIRYQMADFLIEETKYRHAVELLAEAIYHDIIHQSAKGYCLQIELRKEGVKSEPLESFAEYVSNYYNFGFKKLEKVFSLMEICGNERKNLLSDCYTHLGFTDYHMEKHEFIRLILSYMDGNNEEFIRICNVLQERCLRESKRK